jgi:hypothetical protein
MIVPRIGHRHSIRSHTEDSLRTNKPVQADRFARRAHARGGRARGGWLPSLGFLLHMLDLG